jgi:hypothetical protein
VCVTDPPELRALPGGRRVACHFAEEIAASPQPPAGDRLVDTQAT